MHTEFISDLIPVQYLNLKCFTDPAHHHQWTAVTQSQIRSVKQSWGQKESHKTFLLLSLQERRSTISTFGSRGRSEQQIFKKEPPFGRPNCFYFIIQFYSGNTSKARFKPKPFPAGIHTRIDYKKQIHRGIWTTYHFHDS